MKTVMIKKLITPLFLGLATLVLSTSPAFAASATVSLISAGSATKGSYITVTIKENSGAEPVTAASATLSYPTDKLS
jgi:hypothetical protein